VRLYRYFNTNNLWVNLPALQQVLAERNGVLGLPLIRNEKPIDPTDLGSPHVYQLETAMGSAIDIFPGAQAICTPRSRFLPVKKNNDLLLLLSDVYRLTPEYHLELTIDQPPLIILDERYYQLIDDLQERFPHGAPSLRQCTKFHVQGDVYFGKDVLLKGDVQVINRREQPLRIADGEEIA
jgi:UTP--glucose-1-phosphate uridylyltransferase